MSIPCPAKTAVGFVLDVQADLLSHLATRAVVPLRPEPAAPKPIGELNPVFEIAGVRHVMITQAIASIVSRDLGARSPRWRTNMTVSRGRSTCS